PPPRPPAAGGRPRPGGYPGGRGAGVGGSRPEGGRPLAGGGPPRPPGRPGRPRWGPPTPGGPAAPPARPGPPFVGTCHQAPAHTGRPPSLGRPVPPGQAPRACSAGPGHGPQTAGRG